MPAKSASQAPPRGGSAGAFSSSTNPLYKTPSSDELYAIQQSNLQFKSNFLKLHLKALIEDVAPLHAAASSSLEKLLSELIQFLSLYVFNEEENDEEKQFWEEGGGGGDELEKFLPFIGFKWPLEICQKSQFRYLPPTGLELMGSFSLKATIEPTKNVDIAVKMPSQLFHGKDYLNYRYLGKRAAYVGLLYRRLKIAANLRPSHTHSIVSSNSLHSTPPTRNPLADRRIALQAWQGDIYKPVIVLLPASSSSSLNSLNKGKKHTHISSSSFSDPLRSWSIRLIPSLPRDTFQEVKLSPYRNCLRFSREFDEEEEEEEEGGRGRKSAFADDNRNSSERRRNVKAKKTAKFNENGGFKEKKREKREDFEESNSFFFTKLYNSAVLEDTRFLFHRTVLQECIDKFPFFSDALILVKIWSFQRGISSHYNSQSGFFTGASAFGLSMICAHLCLSGNVSVGMSSIQFLRVFFNFLKTFAVSGEQHILGVSTPTRRGSSVSVAGTDSVESFSYKTQGFSQRRGLILWDSENKEFDVLWRFQPHFEELHYLACKSSQLMDSSSIAPEELFTFLFGTKVSPELLWDSCVQLTHYSNPASSYSAKAALEDFLALKDVNDVTNAAFAVLADHKTSSSSSSSFSSSSYSLAEKTSFYVSLLTKGKLNPNAFSDFENLPHFSVAERITDFFIFALGDRLEFMSLRFVAKKVEGEECFLVWDHERAFPPLQNSLSSQSVDLKYKADLGVGITVGLGIKAFHQMVDKCPATSDEGIITYRNFWGSRAETRRFRDNSIVDSVVWEMTGNPSSSSSSKNIDKVKEMGVNSSYISRGLDTSNTQQSVHDASSPLLQILLGDEGLVPAVSSQIITHVLRTHFPSYKLISSSSSSPLVEEEAKYNGGIVAAGGGDAIHTGRASLHRGVKGDGKRRRGVCVNEDASFGGMKREGGVEEEESEESEEEDEEEKIMKMKKSQQQQTMKLKKTLKKSEKMLEEANKEKILLKRMNNHQNVQRIEREASVRNPSHTVASRGSKKFKNALNDMQDARNSLNKGLCVLNAQTRSLKSDFEGKKAGSAGIMKSHPTMRSLYETSLRKKQGGHSIDGGIVFHGFSSGSFWRQSSSTRLRKQLQVFDDFQSLICSLSGLPLAVRNFKIANPESFQLSPHSEVEDSRRVYDAVIEFESSSAWPVEPEPVAKLKMAFLLNIRTELSNDHGIDSTAVEDRLEVTYSGHLFHLRIYHSKELATASSMILDANIRFKYRPNPSQLEDLRRLWWKPQVMNALAHLSRMFPAFSGSLRLVKLWLHTHFFYDCDEIADHIVAFLFVQPGAFAAPPNSPHVALMRFFAFLVAKNSWQTDGIIFSLDAEDEGIEADKLLLMKLSMERTRKGEFGVNSIPSIWIATPHDPHVLLIQTPSSPTLGRLLGLAKQGILIFRKYITMQPSASHEKISLLIKPNYYSFDLVIALSPPQKEHPIFKEYRNFELFHSSLGSSIYDAKDRILTYYFRTYFSHLLKRFGKICIFGFNPSSSSTIPNEILIKFNPSSLLISPLLAGVEVPNCIILNELNFKKKKKYHLDADEVNFAQEKKASLSQKLWDDAVGSEEGGRGGKNDVFSAEQSASMEIEKKDQRVVGSIANLPLIIREFASLGRGLVNSISFIE